MLHPSSFAWGKGYMWNMIIQVISCFPCYWRHQTQQEPWGSFEGGHMWKRGGFLDASFTVRRMLSLWSVSRIQTLFLVIANSVLFQETCWKEERNRCSVVSYYCVPDQRMHSKHGFEEKMAAALSPRSLALLLIWEKYEMAVIFDVDILLGQ